MTGWVMLGLEAAGRNPLDVRSGGETPVDYLRSQVDRLRSTGDLERTILALDGGGLDPRRFAGADLVAELRAQPRPRRLGRRPGQPDRLLRPRDARRRAPMPAQLGAPGALAAPGPEPRRRLGLPAPARRATPTRPAPRCRRSPPPGPAAGRPPPGVALAAPGPAPRRRLGARHERGRQLAVDRLGGPGAGRGRRAAAGAVGDAPRATSPRCAPPTATTATRAPATRRRSGSPRRCCSRSSAEPFPLAPGARGPRRRGERGPVGERAASPSGGTGRGARARPAERGAPAARRRRRRSSTAPARRRARGGRRRPRRRPIRASTAPARRRPRRARRRGAGRREPASVGESRPATAPPRPGRVEPHGHRRRRRRSRAARAGARRRLLLVPAPPALAADCPRYSCGYRSTTSARSASVRLRRWTSRRDPHPAHPQGLRAASRSTRETLDELLELARWAPNHHLTNPWRFRVLGPRALERLKRAAGPEAAAKLDRAPTLVVCSCALGGDEVAGRGGPARDRHRRLHRPARRPRPRPGRLLAHARGAAHAEAGRARSGSGPTSASSP